jgi:UDP-N-acetylmuramate-alanine ligase
VTNPDKHLFDKKELVEYAARLTNEVFLTLGAGDIGLLTNEIVNTLKKR